MGSSKTRLGLSATSRGRYGSFAGKTPEVTTGRPIRMIGPGGLVGPGGMIGIRGSLG